MNYDLSVELCGVRLKNPLVNGSGVRSSAEELAALAPYLGAVELKTATYKPRMGNETPTNICFLNSMGLPNPGYKATLQYVNETDMNGVPVIFNLAGETEYELAEMVQAADSCGQVKIIKLNASCPNITKGEKKGLALCGDNELMYRHAKVVAENTGKPVDVKVSPAWYCANRNFFIDNIGAAINAGANIISGVNTMPGGMAIDIYRGNPILASPDGRGGMAGPGLKPIGIGCIRLIRDSFPDICIGGGGGIYDDPPLDAIEYMRAGADYVSIATKLGELETAEDAMFFQSFQRRFKNLMAEIGVTRASDITYRVARK